MSIVCHLVSINPWESIAVTGDFCMFTFSGRGLAQLCFTADYICKKNMTNCSPEWQKGNELTSQLARRIVESNHPWVRDLTNRHHGHPLRIWYQWIIWRTSFSVYFVRGLLCVCVCVCVCVHRKDSLLAFFQKTFFADQLTLSALHIRTFPLSTFFLSASPSSRQMEERENS